MSNEHELNPLKEIITNQMLNKDIFEYKLGVVFNDEYTKMYEIIIKLVPSKIDMNGLEHNN